jgi:hypothetical protein
MKDPVSAGFFFFNERLLLADSSLSILVFSSEVNVRYW